MTNNKEIIIFIGAFLVFFVAIFFLFEKKQNDNQLEREKQREYAQQWIEYYNSYAKSETEESVKFLFFGDLMLDRHVREVISRQGVDHIFSLLNEESFTKDYDYVFANLEGAVTDGGKHYPPELLYDFAFEPETVGALKDYNFNIFNLANNHLSDQGNRGILETHKNLNDLGFYYFGCRDGYISSSDDLEDNCSLIITEKNDFKIAWLGFSMVYQTINSSEIVENIKLAKEESDFVIVSPHWGIEYQELASQTQRNLAREMVEAGADLIIGHHPHVIQDYEKYQDSYIFYSLGNFIFDQYFSSETQKGLAVSIELGSDGQIEKELYEIKTDLSKIVEIIKIDN